MRAIPVALGPLFAAAIPPLAIVEVYERTQNLVVVIVIHSLINAIFFSLSLNKMGS